MSRGLFITFEGGEGAGKTTALIEIQKWLKEKNITCITTREPGGIRIAEDIRGIILDTKNDNMEGRTEALLYAAARRQHLYEKVIPVLNDGAVVLCDRFIDSSLAYQGHARGIGIDEVYKINEFAIDGYMPDLTILFDLEPETGLKRIQKNSDREVNRLDLEKLEFHKKVREGYDIIYNSSKERIVKINADKSKEEVVKEIKEILKSRFKAYFEQNAK